MKICDGEYSVRFIDLPESIEGITALDASGHANIYINARAATNVQRRAIRHELAHLRRDDCYNNKAIRTIENTEVINHA